MNLHYFRKMINASLYTSEDYCNWQRGKEYLINSEKEALVPTEYFFRFLIEKCTESPQFTLPPWTALTIFCGKKQVAAEPS